MLQGNPPLDIPTRELREKNWGKGSLEFYIAADDIEGRKRSDAALYYVSKTLQLVHISIVNVVVRTVHIYMVYL